MRIVACSRSVSAIRIRIRVRVRVRNPVRCNRSGPPIASAVVRHSWFRGLRAKRANCSYFTCGDGAESESCMARVQSYRDLDAWQIGMDIVVQTYEICSGFPQQERYELSAQMRKASVSIPSKYGRRMGARDPARGSVFRPRGDRVDRRTGHAARSGAGARFVQTAPAAKLQSLIDRQRQLLYGMKRERSCVWAFRLYSSALRYGRCRRRSSRSRRTRSRTPIANGILEFPR